MKIQQEVLLNNLKQDVQVILDCVEAFREEKDALRIQPVPGQWSITQILEHLNSYGRYYLPAIDRALCSSPSRRDAWFNSGFLGNYFTNLIRPANVFEVKNKMKTQKAHDPENNLDPDKVLDEFVQQQQQLLQLLDHAAAKSLNDIKVPISVSKVVKLKLGDTFRFLIGHEQRHMIQARNALHTIGLSTGKFPAILQATPQ
ncbi:DinB family protein [Paraflavisolibacter sp. H34]|uniref:DinB family protein n=1 Tax=Huijunlia imazamoxiresistens TaxID=3127457 RepID=UPI00301AB77D